MKQAIVARKDLGMGAGKLAAQVAHASLAAYEEAGATAKKQWRGSGQKKVVLRADSEADLREIAEQARRAGLPVSTIRDAGHTQLEPGTLTAVGIGPAAEADLDHVTGELSLY